MSRPKVLTSSYWFPRRRALVISLTTLAGLFLVSFFARDLYVKKLLDDERSRVGVRIEAYVNAVEIAFTELTSKLDGLRVFVSLNARNGTIERKLFDTYAAGLQKTSPWVRTFQFVKEGVIRYSFPLKGNEAIIGVDLMKDPRPFIGGDVLRAFERMAPTLTGPTDLIQGGQGMIMREPVSDQRSHVIGLVAAVVDVDSFLTKTGLSTEHSNLLSCLVDSTGRVFYGDGGVVSSQPVHRAVPLPDGTWQYYAVPAEGWSSTIAGPSNVFSALLIAVSVLFAGIVYLGTVRNSLLQLKVDDRTAELGNIVSLLEDDIAKREEVERSLKHSESRNRALVEAVPDLLFVFDPDATFIDFKAAPGMETLVPLEQTLGRKAHEVVPGTLADEIVDHVEASIRTGELQHHEYTLGIGNEMRFYEARYKAGEDKNVVAIIRDITERKRSEDLLRESREYYKQFFENDLTGDFIMGPDGRIVSCNAAFARMFGFSGVEEVLKATPDLFYPEGSGRDALLERIRKERKLEYDEADYHRLDGSTMCVVQNIVGIFDDDGGLKQIRGYIFDDTRRKLLETQVRESQKFESLGTLAGGIAHDFNNILGIIIGYAALLQDRPMSHEEVKRRIGAILKTSHRGAALVNQLLTIARKSDMERESLCINDTVREVAALLAETVAKSITISVDVDEQIRTIHADPSQLHQVLLNLCVNARDAMSEGGTLSMRTRNVRGESVRREIGERADADYVVVRVEDTGMGMSPDVRQRIFEPFFTTKDRGKGSGLGLAIAFGIVRNHGGHISVRSAPGKGTTFSLYFPAVTEAVQPVDEAETEKQNVKGNETILFVEDEELIRGLVEGELRRSGYTVVVAEDGEQALQTLQRMNGKIDIVVSDLDLPKASGIDIFRYQKGHGPGIPFILASGFVEPDKKKAFLQEGILQIIPKPYEVRSLLTAVRAALDRSRDDPS